MDNYAFTFIRIGSHSNARGFKFESKQDLLITIEILQIILFYFIVIIYFLQTSTDKHSNYKNKKLHNSEFKDLKEI